MRYITLGNYELIELGSYVKAIKYAIANPEQEFTHGLRGWWPATGKQIREEFFDMVQDHCNRGLEISRKTKEQIIIRAYKDERPARCKCCRDSFTRRNPFNDRDRYCEDCR